MAMAGDFSVPLTLSSLCEGKLEEEFQSCWSRDRKTEKWIATLFDCK